MEYNNPHEAISEDTVHCIFFPMVTPSADDLQDLCDSVNKTISNLSIEHIWHKDNFKVHIPLNTDKTDFPSHLISVTSFGDNIEEEWFIVYLLLVISKEYPSLVIQVYDNDGEFLLIEAADALPTWANPNTTENRVFIHQGHIRFIPSSIVDTDTDIKLHEAIKIVYDMPDLTKSDDIHTAVIKRIGDYPSKITESIHRAVINLPVDIATVLALKPSLISPMVNAYCYHDVIDAKSCKSVKMDNHVQTQVKFTKCLYAMLIHSKLIRTATSTKICKSDKKSELGYKLTCGFQIIMNKLSGDVFSSKEFNTFLKSLIQNGYFNGNIKGSQHYNQLLENAKSFFLNMECPINTQVCSHISQLMQTQDFFNLKDTIKRKQSSKESFSEDSDEWLSINPDQLNDLLNLRYGRKTNYKNVDVISSQTVTSELSNFLKQTSDFEGIETHNNNSEEIEFDSELFVKSLKNMLDIISPGNDKDSDFDEDEYEDIPLPDEDLDKELQEKLNIDGMIGTHNSKEVLNNMIQSMKEEEGATGPSSNILRSVGFNKSDILDSDDDDVA